MFRSIIAVTAVCLFALPVWAGDKVSVSKRECMRLVRHMPAPDVAYQAGVDVRGRKVIPADLNRPSPIQVPKEIVIDLGIDIAEKYAMTGYSATTQSFGKVSVDPLSGAIKMNGAPLDGDDAAAINKACRAMYGQK